MKQSVSPQWTQERSIRFISYFTILLCISLCAIVYYESDDVWKSFKKALSSTHNFKVINLNNPKIYFENKYYSKIPNLTRINITGPWDSLPSYELNIRLSSIEPRWFWIYQRWFLKSLRLFWPPELYNITIVLNSERPADYVLGNQILLMWPFPRVVYIDRPIAAAIGTNRFSDRFRMYYDAFYPELYTKAEYIGFVDTDTLFTTPVTPQSLFEDKKPIVVGIAGKVYYAKCTEYILKANQLMICMSYFPVTIKVSHLVAMRLHIEKLHGKSFAEVFGEAVLKVGGGIDGCLCQFAIMCNYIYRFHASEYSFRIQMHPDDKFSNNFSESEKIPFPRVAIHSRHLIPYRVVDAMDKASIIMFNERMKEGICRAIGFQWCPNVYCAEFNKSSLQHSLFAFEYYDWSWDERCLKEQEKHYTNVRNLIEYKVRNGIKLFGLYESQADACALL